VAEDEVDVVNLFCMNLMRLHRRLCRREELAAFLHGIPLVSARLQCSMSSTLCAEGWCDRWAGASVEQAHAAWWRAARRQARLGRAARRSWITWRRFFAETVDEAPNPRILFRRGKPVDAGSGLRVDYDEHGVPLGIEITTPSAVIAADLNSGRSR
jgi:hypothetical protein